METPTKEARARTDAAEQLSAAIEREGILHDNLTAIRREKENLQTQLEGSSECLLLAKRDVAVISEQRDAAETRFVNAREEASELEQEMADLRNELSRTKALRARAEASVAMSRIETVALFWLAAALAVAAALLLAALLRK